MHAERDIVLPIPSVCLPSSDVNKDWTYKDKDKDQAYKDQDNDKD